MIPRLLLLAGALLSLGAMEPPAQPAQFSPAEAAREGRALAAKLVAQQPAHNFTNTGIMTIGRRTQVPVRFEIIVTGTNWLNVYEAATPNSPEKWIIIHTPGKPNEYRRIGKGETKSLFGNDAMVPFAGSDFSLADLGMEFFHWPEQRILRSDMKKGQSCRVLESTNPKPAPGASRRVESWIDMDSGGIVQAVAYDAQDKKLKEYNTKSLRKVEGEWQLDEIEIYNRQTSSRTRIEFNVARD